MSIEGQECFSFSFAYENKITRNHIRCNMMHVKNGKKWLVQIPYPGEYKGYQIENISGVISLNRKTDICTYLGALTCGKRS